jgi:predicted Zn-dependent protease
MRYFVRFSAFLLLILCAGVGPLCSAQTNVPPTSATAGSEAESPLPPAVAEAEEAIVKSDWKTAEAKLAPYVAAHPDDARALFDAGYVADAQNKLDDAAGFYRRAVKANPKSFEAQLSLGLLLARQGKLDDARPELEAATKLDPGAAGNEAKARAWRALSQIDRANDPALASDELLQALKLTPETPRDTLHAADLAAQANQPDEAEAAYRRVLAEDAKNAQAEAGLTHILLGKKQFAEAELEARKGLEDAPGDPGLTAELAAALAAQDKPEALPLLEKLHTDRPQDENVTRMLAEVTAQAGNAAASDKLYGALLARHPRDPELLVPQGQNLIREQKYPQALQTFSTATEVDPTDGDAWSGMAFAASKTGNPSMALHALTMRSKYLPENASTYFLWATSYDTLHDRNAAITYYHHFLEAAAGKFPDQEWQARQRLLLLEKKR